MKDHFYKHNMRLDKEGERLSSFPNCISRIISRDCVGFVPEDSRYESSVYEYFDKHENKIPKPRKPEVIPLDELTHCFYFQWRLDYVDPEALHHKIIIGVCRDNFGVNADVSRARDVWCMNLATGDINTGKKWKDYYPVDEDAEPPYGYFEKGTVVGVLIDMQRGMINFYKDGADLGQAFVETRIKFGQLHPFVET